MAKLYTKGEGHGIHPFMVQLRNLETHEPLPGINVGEIGPKMGLRSADNGFLKVDEYSMMLFWKDLNQKDNLFLHTKLQFSTN